ncbi:DUF2802 domain-containing protein [Paraglaciecola sp. 2405UD69-4]|uniref:DUF2802 domain-containing protein n=1 Tax=Paraglaciecola sp. 2405UD69-4 TaxID=3391836 RepID=UPI0039C8C861
MTIPLILSIVACVIAVFCLGLIFKSYKRNKDVWLQTQSCLNTLSELSSGINLLREELHEVRSGSIGVSKRVKGLSQELKDLQSAHQLLAEQDPQSRFYNKAAKLINDGASLSEVINECDMPTAEAELLFNLHKNSR